MATTGATVGRGRLLWALPEGGAVLRAGYLTCSGPAQLYGGFMAGRTNPARSLFRPRMPTTTTEFAEQIVHVRR